MVNNCGIYKWTNKVNGKVYIGQSVDLEKRKNKFLNFNIEYAGFYINRARKKYNDISFWDYEVLEYCIEEKLNEKEIYYIELYNSTNEYNGYNLTEGGKGGRVNGFTLSEETKKKISNSHKGKKLSELHKHKMRLSRLGKKLSEETRQKISEGNKGKKLSEETKKKISSSHKGKIISEKTRSKMVESHTGKKLNNETVKKIIEGVSKPVYQIEVGTNEIIKKWDSIKQAKLELNIEHISECCKGKRKTAGGFIWKYVEEDI